jgi:hypothetical protein
MHGVGCSETKISLTPSGPRETITLQNTTEAAVLRYSMQARQNCIVHQTTTGNKIVAFLITAFSCLIKCQINILGANYEHSTITRRQEATEQSQG